MTQETKQSLAAKPQGTNKDTPASGRLEWAEEFIDRLRQKYKERAEPERDLVDNRKAVARTRAVRQTTGRPLTELELSGQD